MTKTFAKAPSPCIDVCKFRDEGHCIGCRMTKPEKKRFKRLEGKAAKKAFFRVLTARLEAAGRYAYWSRMYRRRCEKKGRPCPLDKLETPLRSKLWTRAGRLPSSTSLPTDRTVSHS